MRPARITTVRETARIRSDGCWPATATFRRRSTDFVHSTRERWSISARRRMNAASENPRKKTTSDIHPDVESGPERSNEATALAYPGLVLPSRGRRDAGDSLFAGPGAGSPRTGGRSPHRTAKLPQRPSLSRVRRESLDARAHRRPACSAHLDPHRRQGLDEIAAARLFELYADITCRRTAGAPARRTFPSGRTDLTGIGGARPARAARSALCLPLE